MDKPTPLNLNSPGLVHESAEKINELIVLLGQIIDQLDVLYSADVEGRMKRQKEVDGLIAGAAGTPGEALVTALFQHYAAEVAQYVQIGGVACLDAIAQETDPTIVGYLDTPMSAEPGDTIRDRILRALVRGVQ